MFSSYTTSDDKLRAINRGEVSLQELIDILLDFSFEPLQMAAVQQIQKMGESARQPAIVKDLTRALILANDNIRMHAAAALNAMGKTVCDQPAVRAALSKALTHIDWTTVSGQCAGGMIAVALANPEFFEKLVKQLQDPLEKERIIAASIIHGLQKDAADPKIIAEFPKALEDKSATVREKIAGSMRNIGKNACSEETIPAIIKALKDPVTNVRSEMILAIELMYPASDDPRIIKAVEDLLKVEQNRSIICDAMRISGLLSQSSKEEVHQEPEVLNRKSM